MNKMTVDLDIPHDPVERVARQDTDRECQCPNCGRLHRNLRAGKPPPNSATVTAVAFYAYHPGERKARAREALRHTIESAFRRNETDGMIDVYLEGLWNIMAGHNDV
jgi:hypothetical protein